MCQTLLQMLGYSSKQSKVPALMELTFRRGKEMLKSQEVYNTIPGSDMYYEDK